MSNSSRPVVLIVEDEPAVTDSYVMMLGDQYDIRTAENGPEALKELDDSVDVILLDRMLPGMSGDEILEEIRDRDVDCRVAMVSAVDPDFDIVEMGFDDYVTKPPTREELRGTVEDLLSREEYSKKVNQYHSLVSKRAALATEKSEEELAESEEFARLEERIEDHRADLAQENERLLDDAEFLGALRDLAGERAGYGADGEHGVEK